MKFKTYSLGCKVNIYEVEAISSELKLHGYELVENDSEADVIIINTCTVTSTSDSKSKQLIRKIRRLAPNAIIVAMGCFVQLNAETVKKELDVNIVIGTNKRNQIISLIEEYLQKHRYADLCDHRGDLYGIRRYIRARYPSLSERGGKRHLRIPRSLLSHRICSCNGNRTLVL